MIQPGVLISVVNHENTSNALSLARRFREHAETLLIDSGSVLTEDQADRFDIVLPNVYYSGLFNETLRQAAARPRVNALLYVCSDVLIEDTALLVDRMVRAFADDSIGVYTPSNTGKGHAFCAKQEGSDLRDIPFVDGYIFGLRRSVFSRFRPVDLEKNLLGWGIDVRTGFVAASMGLRTLVDDGVSVNHPDGCGYDQSQAYDQMVSWLGAHQDGSLRYYMAYKRLQRLSRFGLSRFAAGRVSPLELMLFRWIAKT